MIETMKMTVMTPTLTPSMVSDERSLFARKVSRAIRADSLMSSSLMSGQRTANSEQQGRKEQRAKSEERRAKSKKRRAKSEDLAVRCLLSAVYYSALSASIG